MNLSQGGLPEGYSPRHTNLKVSLTELSGTYFQVSVYRISLQVHALRLSLS